MASYPSIVIAALILGVLLGSRQETNPTFPSRDQLTIEVVHDDQATCASYPKTSRCADTRHWTVTLNGARCPDRSRAEAFIKDEATRHPSGDPKQPDRSQLKTKVAAESGAPYAVAENVLATCATAGIHILEIGEKKTGSDVGVAASPLGVAAGPFPDIRELLVLIGKQDPQEKTSFRWVEAAGLKEAIDDAAKDLGPRDELPVVLKPVGSTIWAEVLQVLASCKKMGFERIEFAAPFKVSDLPKK